MSPGAMLLRLRQRFGDGVVTAYYRDVVRPRILETEPVTGIGDNTCEIHVMTCAQDWLNLMWTLKSFYRASGRKYALCIHDDGSLSDHAVASLAGHFPSARIIRRPESDTKLESVLKGFPRCMKFRETNLLAPKIFDFAAYLESDRMGLFDSDLLFFKAPTGFLERVEDSAFAKNAFNSDVESSYTVDPGDVKQRFGFELQERVNSGLGLVHRGSLRLDWVEEFLTLPEILDGHFWRIEQTLFALCSSRYGVELLPEEYTLYLSQGIGSRPFRHYVGKIRHLMYREGMASLMRQGLLNGA